MRRLFWSLIKRLLFRVDAESAHHLMVRMIQLLRGMGRAPLRIASGAPRFETLGPRIGREVWGLGFASPLGLAAGFDKNADILSALPELGFGFAEIGTVTPRPQAGNDRPRLFRDPSINSLFNRMGFNGLGAEVVRRSLIREREKLPTGFMVGVNIGKNKDTPNDQAASDYLKAARAFESLADYLVINVSSPNTPGLRALQSAEALQPIIEGVASEVRSWKRVPPLLLKLAPELEGVELEEVLSSVEKWGVDGFILANTLGGSWPNPRLQGGWSGSILTEKSRAALRTAKKVTRKPIISVGGIDSEQEALLRFRDGADLIQIYSGWVFNGPSFPVQITRAIQRELAS